MSGGLASRGIRLRRKKEEVCRQAFTRQPGAFSVSRCTNWLVAAVIAASPAVVVVAAPPGAAPPPPVAAADATADSDVGRDRSWTYRYDPLTDKLFAVRQSEVKPGIVYGRYHTGSGRWVWGKASSDGSLHYQIGPGSVQEVRYFDLQGTAAEQRRALEQRAPELARLLTIQGARPTLRLDEVGRWQLGPTPHVSNVFDETTGERWEWHGDRPSAVIHSCGRLWTYSNGRYLPLR